MRRAAPLLLSFSWFLFPAAACSQTAVPAETPALGHSASSLVEHLRVRVLRWFPHDRGAYTQGLLWDEGFLVESTGRYGSSVLRRWRPSASSSLTGGVEEVVLQRRFFGEGVARFEDRFVQLTWREGKALIYDRRNLRQIDSWSYRGEGWGLCHDGSHFVMSDGTAFLTIRDPTTFAVVDRLQVLLEGRPVSQLNELEWAEGWIYANVYQTDSIVRIEPTTGVVRAVMDASGLLTAKERRLAGVLNGIAYEPESETFFLTGKLWPKVFQVTFE